MTPWTLSMRGLRYYRKTVLSVVAGLGIAATVLIGALVVGDSVSHTLNRLALDRVGRTHYAVSGGERFFRAELARELGERLKVDAAPVILLEGSVARDDGSGRINRVQIVGYDASFFKLSPAGSEPEGPPNAVYLNAALARKSGLQAGNPLLIRMAKPSALPRDAPLSTDEDLTTVIRDRVGGVLSDDEFGRFGLKANQAAPYTVFVPMAYIHNRIDMPGRANLVLLGGSDKHPGPDPVRDALVAAFSLEDAQLSLTNITARQQVELRSQRIFLDPEVEAAALKAHPDAEPLLTYLATGFRAGTNTTPYSMVTARGTSIQPDHMVINEWLARDLGVKPGDSVAMSYFVMGDRRKFIEQTGAFTVSEVVPLAGAALDPALMPDFPGISKSANCKDWDPGFKMNHGAIRDKDEDYWDTYGGTPKAFIALDQGQELWKNRFGNVTAVRYPASAGRRELADALMKGIDPAALGMQVVPFREQALKASQEAMAFGGLFMGFSFFLIIASLLLSGLLFVFGIEQRSREIGTLLAVGYTPKQVRGLFLREGLVLSVTGALIGMAGGPLYTWLLLKGLDSIWESAIGQTAMQFHMNPVTIAGGAAGSVIIGLLTIWITMRKQARQPVQALLSGVPVQPVKSRPRRNRAVPVGVVCLAGALAITAAAAFGPQAKQAGSFYSAGSLLLIAGLAFCLAFLRKLASGELMEPVSMRNLNLRSLSRRRGRSIATIALLACGAFMVIATQAFRQDSRRGSENRSSGTGGFDLIAEFTQPLLRDLNDPAERDFYGLEESLFAGVRVFPGRVRQGDDASCLNLNRAQTPRLIGIESATFSNRFTFAKSLGPAKSDPWARLSTPESEDAIPAIGDMNAMQYAMGKKIGDRLTYLDENGKPFDVVLVGGLANSIMQGSLLIEEREFRRRFPSVSGYQVAWMTVPQPQRKGFETELLRAFADFGVDVTGAAERLNEFNAIQNTYISIFQVLGGLGLLLGSIGLGIVVLRNMLERRGELALFRALGYTREQLIRQVFHEHRLLLLLGILCGAGAGLLAVVPSLLAPGTRVPVPLLALTVVVIIGNGLLWTAAASRWALSGNLLEALRNE